METLQINPSSAQETLDYLRHKIHQQRTALRRGYSSSAMGKELAAWEQIVQELQTESLSEKNAQMGLLYEVSQQLNVSLDWEETIQTVIDAVIQLTGAERGMLVLQEDGELHTKVMRNATGKPFSEEDLNFSKSIVQRALAEKRPLLTSNAQIDPRFQGSESIFAFGLRSILCAPLIYRNTELGVIYVENRAHAGIFSADDLAILAAFTNQAAVALANARTHQATDRALAQRVDELTLLQAMTRDLNGRLDFNRVMEHSIAWAIKATRAASGMLGLPSPEGIRWLSASTQLTPEDTEMAKRVLRRRQPNFSPERIILPLMRENRPLGVFYLVAGTTLFTTKELELVTRLADNAAIAVENARLYEALLQANRAKSEFVSLVSHELRTPMTSIRGYSEMLQKGMAGELSAQQQQFVEAIQRNADRMRILIKDLLDISRIETGHLKIQPVAIELSPVLKVAYQTVEEMLTSKQQEFHAELDENLPALLADPDRLTQVLINLLSNAVKYTPAGGQITVRARFETDRKSSFVRCAVTDTGYGIGLEDQRKLFTKFFRSENPHIREEVGTGLGLTITKNLVELHGGEIRVESTIGAGTTVCFTMPVAGVDSRQ
ncbi:MAG: ATP-binding protein [Chloroflexota bacterium]|nr:ATP-binding protein [Chloroflexota bacterium]